MSAAETYRAHAATAARDAAEATLPHVKERNLRSEAAWTAMAVRFEAAEIQQAARIADQVARKQAAELL